MYSSLDLTHCSPVITSISLRNALKNLKVLKNVSTTSYLSYDDEGNKIKYIYNNITNEFEIDNYYNNFIDTDSYSEND